MVDGIYRDGLSAWRALRETGGLDLDDRDDGLVEKLKERLDPGAPDLETALAEASTDAFLSALFASIQPFVAMFSDILRFFEMAGAHQGQSQWRVSVGDEFLDFRHFEEFLEHWRKIDAEFEVPALNRRHAFILNDVRAEVGGYDYLIDGMDHGARATTGLPDVDAWLADYDEGRYGSFPASIMPDKFPPGLSDAATVILAAVTIIRRQGFSREAMLQEHRARGYRSIDDDALHPWTIAQSETDYWLRSHVGYLANLLRRPDQELHAIARKLVERFAPFARRRIPGQIEVKDLERLLSLPVWKQRYETYGVWVATQIAGSLDDHDIKILSSHGELRFAFGEARIADIDSANPRLSLFAERRVALTNPVGKSRIEGAQPDFGLWTQDASNPECVLVVEVKHYKKRSRRNFRDALIDYSRGHPRASIVLVNYGPVGDEFNDLPDAIGKRCLMIGHLMPDNFAPLAKFRDLVREIVGHPVPRLPTGASDGHQIIALDVSGSMRAVLASSGLPEFLTGPSGSQFKIALIDVSLRAVVDPNDLKNWLATNTLGNSNVLAVPVAELLTRNESIIVVTDDDGVNDLRAMSCTRLQNPRGVDDKAIFLRVDR
ncbi:MAG: hypothetical protein WCS75_07455 [Sphingomonas sp.]|uniref:hypothetical protein n=1 Tax=Sphingomonas sp. TaxID=28214 RepID=UPI00356A8A2E